jgi:hypothetical protein
MRKGLWRRLVYVAIFFTAFGIYVSRAAGGGGLDGLPEAGDGQDYDAIAYNLWKGRGFGYYWSDPAWRLPYEGNPKYRGILTRQSDFYPTTYRPPAMPYLLSAVYALTDRNFAAWRIVSCGIMAGAVTVTAAIAAQIAGLPAALIAAAIALQSRELSRYSAMFMTESLAIFFVALLTWTWIRGSQKGWTARSAAASGLVMGGLLAARTIFVLWTPLVLLLPGRDRSFDSRFAWRTKAICLAVAIVAISPWWIRNIVVTKAFMPLGTQGAINLPMAFGPRALRAEGMWASNPGDGWAEISAKKLDVVTSEVMLARYRSNLALNWMRENPSQVLHLMRLHVWQELRPRRPGLLSKWLLPAAGIAALFFWKSPAAWVILLVVCANILSIAATYAEGGRFMVPVQPPMIGLVAGMLAAAAIRAHRFFRAWALPRL